MASAGTTAAALLFSFSAVVLFLVLQEAAPSTDLAGLLVSALDRLLDGRRLLELATRRNMILLCHAILLVILRDAGVLGSPGSRRRSRSPTREATAVAQTAVLPHATRSAVVWRRRRPRNRAAGAPMHDAAAAADRRLVECQPVADEAAAAWAAPLLTTGPPAQAEAEAEEAAAVASEQIVLAESPRNDDDDLLDQYHARVEQLEHPTATVSDGQTDRYHRDDRHIIAVAAAAADDDDDATAREQQAAGMEIMELADDRTFDEFIESQRRQMRQESLQAAAAQLSLPLPGDNNMLLV